MQGDKRTVDDLLKQKVKDTTGTPEPTTLDRQVLALSEGLLDGDVKQRTLAHQPRDLSLIPKGER